MIELDAKLARIREFMRAHSVDALLLQRVENFAWATCGAASYIDIAVSSGVASLLITPTDRYLIVDNIEAPRFKDEEGLEAQGWNFLVRHWFEKDAAIAGLTRGLRLGADAPYPGAVDVAPDFALLRHTLTPEDILRYRELSKRCAAVMDASVRAVRPGMTENEMAALLGAEAQKRGIVPTVNLVATDDRIFRFRHPLPTDKRLERYGMVILCGRKWGLVCALTRLVHFGRLPDDLRVKADGIARVDAHFIAATRPGRTIGDVFADGQDAYRQAGYPDEWRLHHQGGLIGYLPREVVATPGMTNAVLAGQPYAWNPSIRGTKSEDTILVGEKENEILTEIPGWPVISIEVGGVTIKRPSILEIT